MGIRGDALSGSRTRPIVPRWVYWTLGVAGVLAAIALAGRYAVKHAFDNSGNEKRLAIMSREPVLKCQPRGVALTTFNTNVGSSSIETYDGTVTQNYVETGDPQVALRELGACAKHLGWSVRYDYHVDPPQYANGSYAQPGEIPQRPTVLVGLHAEKTVESHWFGGGWTETLAIRTQYPTFDDPYPPPLPTGVHPPGADLVWTHPLPGEITLEAPHT